MSVQEEVLLLLGGDRGDVRRTLTAAAERIAERAGPIISTSRDHWSEAWGFQDEELFLNRAVLLHTDQTPQALLHTLLEIEKELGRVRTGDGVPGPRAIDIDILFFGDRIIEGPGLILPHPRMHLRRFALEPAADVAPDMRHPLLGRTIMELLDGQLMATTGPERKSAQ